MGIAGSNHFLTSMRSATLERSGVTEIGLKSEMAVDLGTLYNRQLMEHENMRPNECFPILTPFQCFDTVVRVPRTAYDLQLTLLKIRYGLHLRRQ